MILGVLCLASANAAAVLGAGALVDRVRTADPALNAVLFLLFRLVAISAVVLLAGLSGALNAAALGALGAATLLGLVLVRGRAILSLPGRPRPGAVLLVLGGILGVRLLLQAWFFAPYTTDVLSYHLPKVAEWIRTGSFTREMGLDNHATFPAGFELLEAWWVVFLHHDVLIEFAGIEFLLLAFASTYALAKHLGLGDSGRFLAALIFTSSPGVYFQATSCLNDGAVAALVVATLALVVGRAPLSSCVICAGLGVGIKATYAFAVPGLLLLAFLFRKESGPPATSRGTLRILSALALGIGSFWYLRNLAWFGNPVYPVGTAGLVDESGFRWIQGVPGLDSLRVNLDALVHSRVFDSENAVGALLERTAGWGYVAFGCGIPSAAVLLREDPKYRRLFVSSALSLVSVLLLVKPDDWCMRFILFFPAPLAIACAGLVERSRAAILAVGASLLLQIAATTLPAELPWTQFSELRHQGWRERTVAESYLRTLGDEAVGCWGGNDAESYLLYRPDYSRRVVYSRARTPENLLNDLRQGEARVLYAEPGSPSQRQMILDSEGRGLLRHLEGPLYRIP